MKTILAALSIISFSMASYGAENFDFVLIASDCKSTVSFLKLVDKSLQTILSEKPILFCKRNSKVITCNLLYQDSNQETITQRYSIISDAPPMLIFSSENNSELTMVNTSEMAAAYTSRIFDEKYMGYKICSMMFMTQDQYKALSKDKD